MIHSYKYIKTIYCVMCTVYLTHLMRSETSQSWSKKSAKFSFLFAEMLNLKVCLAITIVGVNGCAAILVNAVDCFFSPIDGVHTRYISYYLPVLFIFIYADIMQSRTDSLITFIIGTYSNSLIVILWTRPIM